MRSAKGTAKGKQNDVDRYFEKAVKWRRELKKLRSIISQCGLSEEFKWRKPTYTLDGGNVVILLPLKAHCALLFCKGALLKDPHKILVKPGEHTQAARQLRFSDLHEIEERAKVLKAYVCEAAQVEAAGLEVTYRETSDFSTPEELTEKFVRSPPFKAAFEALTPGRQRGYLIFFSAPKQSKTRALRIAKSEMRIRAGKGMHDP